MLIERLGSDLSFYIFRTLSGMQAEYEEKPQAYLFMLL